MPSNSETDRDDEARSYRVRNCRLTTGERLPLVVGPDQLPVPMPNQWALLLRRPQVQAGTLGNELNTIAHIYEWALRRGIDLDERFTSGNGLRPDEANSLFQNLRFLRKLGRSVAARRLTDAKKLRVVKAAGHAARVAVARDYLVWGLERTLYSLDVSDPRHKPIRERCDLVKRQAVEFQGTVSEGRSSRIGLSTTQRSRLLIVVDPAYERNDAAAKYKFIPGAFPASDFFIAGA